ncbi:MAG: hypothetical protein HOV81_10900 [Kofleriaceae bacterium]|nr:hypothetical protein [Kofleriaceae bacterium]
MWSRIVIMLALASCSHPAPRHPTIMLSESRSLNERTAVGQARVFATPSVHSRLAGARAWLAIAKALAQTPAGAYQAALRGITELGPDYAALHVRDETIEKVWIAKDLFDEQKDQDAAELLTRLLGSRIKMYERRYATEVE